MFNDKALDRIKNIIKKIDFIQAIVQDVITQRLSIIKQSALTILNK